MSYRVVFDVADRLPDIALGLAALVMLAGVIHAGLWQFEDLPAIGLSRQLTDGQAEVIEGPVTIYLEVGGGKNECISVADRQFCYSDWDLTPGFNRTRALGGPIRDGLQVRLRAIGDTIVRLEVAEET